jgi:hypothetical protein
MVNDMYTLMTIGKFNIGQAPEKFLNFIKNINSDVSKFWQKLMLGGMAVFPVNGCELHHFL